MRISAQAPCRVDLAGGTLDLAPVGLLVDDAVTVNVAVDVMTGCTLELGGDGYAFSTDDVGESLRLDRVPDRPERHVPPAFALAASVVRHFDLPPTRCVTWSEAPRGSGLGASSALAVALVAATLRARGDDPRAWGDRAIRVVRDLEARVLGHPAGTQDHLAAWHGGVCVVEPRPGGWTVLQPSVDLAALGDALIVVDSGVQHHSGMNNWSVFRAFFDGAPAAREGLARIARAGARARAALATPDGGLPSMAELAEAMSEDWEARRTLSPAVTCPELEALVTAARAAGGTAKACGAGGGGCVVALAPPGGRAAVERALIGAGGRVLACAPRGQGVELS